MNFFQRFFASLRYREAVRKADKAHALTGNRYYVIPSSGPRRQLVIVDRKNFRLLKLKGYISSTPKVNDLIRECFYCTPYANGDGFLRPNDIQTKYKQFLAWYQGR